MNDKYLDALLSMANLGAPLSMNRSLIDFEARGQAAIDLWAMRTKIDADALDEAGWAFDHDEEAWRRSWFAGAIYVEMDGDNPIVEAVWDSGEGHNYIPFTHVRTMYDLAELHRLLAGAQP